LRHLGLGLLLLDPLRLFRGGGRVRLLFVEVRELGLR
jgi:hypothetical protein